MTKVVYTYVVADMLHVGHLIYLEKAKDLVGPEGKLIVGVLTDEATMEKKQKPIIEFKDRVSIIKSLKCVDEAVPQEEYSPLKNVMEIKPDILVESDSHDIMPANEFMLENKKEVVIIPYYKGKSSTNIKEQIINNLNQKTNEPRKKVYVPMAVDLIHHGHINIINEAKKLGDVTIGLLTDNAISSYKKFPHSTYEERKIIVEGIKGVKEVIPENNKDYTENLKILKPDYVIHADNWKIGPLKEVRTKVIQTIKDWGGELIEPKYTEGILQYNESIKIGVTPETRLKRLKRLLHAKPLVNILEAHNGLSGLIVENTQLESKEFIKEFDGIWISSLTDSTAKGKPDIGCIDFTSRLNTINEILEVTTKPIIFDGDSGGEPEHFVYMIKTLERLGISAIIIEDKVGLKKNSLFGVDTNQNQDSIENFSYKISRGKTAQITEDFMIIARIESLILKRGLDDALKRAKAYIKAGADGIMIHSKENEATEILEFCREYNKFENKVFLVVVPTTYNIITENELSNNGINIIIYANHLLRSAYPAMQKTAKIILENSRSYETEGICMPIKDIITLIPGEK